jgi:hypothetical protein
MWSEWMNIKCFFFSFEMWARSQNQNSDSESSLQSRPCPHTYTRRSVRAHITILPETSAPTYPYLPLPSAPTEPFAHPRPRPSVLPVLARLPAVAHRVSARHPVRAIASAPDVPYTPLRPRPATRLCPLLRRRGGPSGSQRGQGKSNLPWPPVNARLTLTRRARRSIGRTGRAGGRPAPQTTLLIINTEFFLRFTFSYF